MSKAERTISTATEGLCNGQCACLPSMLRTINTLSQRLQVFTQLAGQELGDIICNDTVLLEKVIRAANSIGYNPTGIEIDTIEQAIQTIGLDRIRTLTISLILLEGSKAWQSSVERQEAMLVSLASGILAEEISVQGNEVNREVAFLGGALRGFGRIVLNTYMLDDYRQAETLSQELQPDEAYQEIFGLTPIELGYHLMEASHLSPLLMNAFHEYNPASHRRELLDPGQPLLAVTNLSYQMVQLALNVNLEADAYRRCIANLPTRYKDSIERTPELLGNAMNRSFRNLKALVNANAKTSCHLRTLEQFHTRIDAARQTAETPLDKPVKDASQDPKLPARQKNECQIQAREDLTDTRKAVTLIASIFEESIHRVEELAKEEEYLRAKALEDILNSVRKGLAPDENWIFLRPLDEPTFTFRGGSRLLHDYPQQRDQ